MNSADGGKGCEEDTKGDGGCTLACPVKAPTDSDFETLALCI
jgi:hypothetical protein